MLIFNKNLGTYLPKMCVTSVAKRLAIVRNNLFSCACSQCTSCLINHQCKLGMGIVSNFARGLLTSVCFPIQIFSCCWSLLHSAILHSRANLLHSRVILHKWLAVYSGFLNIHQSGVLTALTWMVPHETAAISAHSMSTLHHVTSCKATCARCLLFSFFCFVFRDKSHACFVFSCFVFSCFVFSCFVFSCSPFPTCNAYHVWSSFKTVFVILYTDGKLHWRPF